MNTMNDTGVWEIWIDDLDGNLAMVKDESMAKAKVEVVEATVFSKVLTERDSALSWQKAAEDRVDELKKALRELLVMAKTVQANTPPVTAANVCARGMVEEIDKVLM